MGFINFVKHLRNEMLHHRRQIPVEEFKVAFILEKNI
jgi:hypothetical protein